MNKMFVRRSGSAPVPSTPSAWRQKITAGLVAAVLCGLTLGANLAEAQTVPQPANPPLWDGVAYGPTGFDS